MDYEDFCNTFFPGQNRNGLMGEQIIKAWQWEQRVQELESEGLTQSDAQDIADLEQMETA